MTSPATIDGLAVTPASGETILAGAARLGIAIPTLCRAEGCAVEAGCRVCVVEIEGVARPRAACQALLEPGMRVRTHSERIECLRRGLLELITAAHPGALRAPPSSDFARLLERHGLAPVATPPTARDSPADHPYLRFDPELCIVCRRCVHACDEIQGQSVYSILGRGGATRLAVGAEDSFRSSDCTSCGACVELCPTGALADRDRAHALPAERKTTTTCGYCGVGCRVEVATARDEIQWISGDKGSSVNHGHLCAKGRYAHGHARSSERLVRPLLREGERWREIDWEPALRLAAQRLAEAHEHHGPAALGVLTSSRSTNEAAYLFQKLFRVRFDTNNVDCCARVCHSSTAEALVEATGTGAATASYADIERASTIVVAGANPTEAHPVVGARIRRAAHAGARLIVIDPRVTELARCAEIHLACRPGSNVSLFLAIAKVLLEDGLADRAYVAARTEGLDELARLLAGSSLEQLAADARLEPQRIRETARALTHPALYVTGLGLSELVQGTDSVLALCNIALLSGSIGRSGAGVLPLRGQNNVQGNADMGAMPDRTAGYQRVGDPRTIERSSEIWGAPVPTSPGLTIPEMLASAHRRELRALWIQGEDVAQSDPDQTRVLEALRSLDFLVVQELFLTETARCAHLVLPAAGVFEQGGTFTNAERRIQLVRPAILPPGEARPDWEVARDLGRALGLAWDYPSPAAVMHEISRFAPELFGGVSHARLEPDGLQWPCAHPAHPGTPTLHAERFLRGRGKLSAVQPRANPEHDVAGFPYLLNTGRVLQHYNVGTMTRRTPQVDLASEDVLEIHPEDAAKEAIQDGASVVVESRWGSTRVHARHSLRVRPGELFLSFHFPGTHANRLVGPHLDARSKCPQYKVTAVRLARVGVG